MIGGFRQLVVELIVLLEWEWEWDLIFGCVIMGEFWIFGFLDKK